MGGIREREGRGAILATTLAMGSISREFYPWLTSYAALYAGLVGPKARTRGETVVRSKVTPP